VGRAWRASGRRGEVRGVQGLGSPIVRALLQRRAVHHDGDGEEARPQLAMARRRGAGVPAAEVHRGPAGPARACGPAPW
jgi:hypothetical protein